MKLVLLLACLLTPAAAHAALEFRVLSWKGDIDGLRYTDGQDETILSVRERVLSPAYRHRGSGDIELYRLETRDAQPPVRIEIATLSPPENLSRALLMLNQTDDGRAHGRWIDDSTEDNPAGSLRLHNFSSHELAVRIGTETRVLPPAANTRVNFPAASRALPVQVAVKMDGEWTRVASTSQPVRPRYRLIVLLRDGRPTLENPVGLVEWLTFYEVPPPAEAGKLAQR